MILDINGGSMLMARTPDRIRGRVNGAFRFMNMGVRPVGAVIGGVLGGFFGVRETLLVVTIASLGGRAVADRLADPAACGSCPEAPERSGEPLRRPSPSRARRRSTAGRMPPLR